jgi:hypothetical protein
MLSAKRAIFREEALQHYKKRNSRDVLPRYISPPVFRAFWVFVLLCFSLLLVAWNIRLPLYLNGVAVVISAQQTPYQDQAGLFALVLFSPAQTSHLHQGMSVSLLLPGGSQAVQEDLANTPALLSPQEVRATYHLDSHLSLLVEQPALVGVLLLRPAELSRLETGALFQAQVQVGSQSLLALLPFGGSLWGGSR